MQTAEALERWLLEQPLVAQVSRVGAVVSFEFDGDDAARQQLLKRMIQHGAEIVEFHAKTESLEDAFMAITKGIMQ